MPMKVFISQPMTGLTDDEIQIQRKEAIKDLTGFLETDFEILNSFVPNVGNENRPLYYLGRAIQCLDEADLAYFVDGWEKSRGCRIEHESAILYGIDILHQV